MQTLRQELIDIYNQHKKEHRFNKKAERFIQKLPGKLRKAASKGQRSVKVKGSNYFYLEHLQTTLIVHPDYSEFVIGRILSMEDTVYWYFEIIF